MEKWFKTPNLICNDDAPLKRMEIIIIGKMRNENILAKISIAPIEEDAKKPPVIAWSYTM